MAAPTYTAPPNDPPVLGSPDFAANAQGYLGWFPTFGAYCEALAAWMASDFHREVPDGTDVAPGLAAASDPNTGIRWIGADKFALVAGGVDQLIIENGQPIGGALVQASATATTVGALMAVGAFGIGAATCPLITDFTVSLRPGFYRYLEASATGAPGTGAAWQGSALVLRSHTDGRTVVYATRHNSANPITWIGVRGTETGALTWTEIVMLDGSGNLGIGTNSPSTLLHAEQSGTGTIGYFNGANASFSGNQLTLDMVRAGNTVSKFIAAYSNGTTDLEFKLSGDGNGTCDGSWTGGGADYAEFFEWSDGNPDEEDRRGLPVVLEGRFIRPAMSGETPFGVISGNPSVIGDGDTNRWKDKYLRDDYGAYIWEDYELISWVETNAEGGGGEQDPRKVEHSYPADAVPEGVTVPADAVRTTQQRRKLNPKFDPDLEYTPRAERPEWDIVGLMGKLRVRKGQPVAPNWIKMRDISAEVEEWLVR